jgi:hypothetical protein
MGNMGYCRFQNTLRDLEDCDHALYSEEELSEEEIMARDKLVALCARIAKDYARPKHSNF